MAGVEAFYGAHDSYALQGGGVGGHAGWDVVALADGDDPLYRVVDAHDALGGSLFIVAFEFVGHVCEAPGVYDVVRRVEDATLDQGIAVASILQDVVGAAGYDGASEARQGIVIDDRSRVARCEDVARDREYLVRLNRFRPELQHGTLHDLRTEIRDDEACSLLVEQASQVVADVSEPLYGDSPAVEGSVAEDLFDAGLHPLQYAQGRKR